jgi:geranylgeranyl pyrophosphate synthase
MELNPWLSEIEEAIKQLLPKEPKETFGILEEYIFRGGKRLRPLMLLNTLAMFGGKPEKGLRYAALIELFHNFTLIHDDIEDGSELRRGKPTLHVTYGIPMALNSGDALYTAIFQELAREKDSFIRQEFADTFRKVVEGQGYEIYWIANDYFPEMEEEYFMMAKRKTGALFGLALGMGAYLAGSDRYKELYQLGETLGLAFQIQDDVLNLESPKEYGKKWADDLTEAKRTLIVIHALQHSPKAEWLKETLLKHPEDDETKAQIIHLMKEAGSIEYAKKVANRLIEKALSVINTLPKNEYRDRLEELAYLLVKRKK